MDYREHRYTSACGQLELFARIYGEGEGSEEGGGQKKPPLLLMHGLTRNSADFEGLAAHLAGNYMLIVPDQRGRGLSPDDPDPTNYRPPVYAEDMFALLADLNVEQPGLIGTSMGGLMAIVMNAMKPETFPAVIFNDVGPVLMDEGLARIGGYVGGGAPMEDWDAAAKACADINGYAYPNYGREDWQSWARRTCRQLPDGRVSFAYDPAIAEGFADVTDSPQPDLWPMWELLGNTPVLVLRGALSDLLSPDTVATMQQRHQGPFVSQVIPDIGHAPFMDEPEALAAIIPFLKEHVG